MNFEDYARMGAIYNTSPYVSTEDIVNIDGTHMVRKTVTNPDGSSYSFVTDPLAGTISTDPVLFGGYRPSTSEEVGPVTNSYTDDIEPGKRVHAVACSNSKDLSKENILKSLSSMKGRLMLQCAPIRLEYIECRMTPDVKRNLIQASKRLAMFGKERPFIARFDDYGRRLPDEIKIDTTHGMQVKIIDPSEHGATYLELTGVTYFNRAD